MTLGVGHVEIVMGTTSHFRFGENPFGFEWGIHRFHDGICGLVLGLHTHPYRLTSDVNLPYRWSTTYMWAKEISRILLRFGFLIGMVIGVQGCPQILVTLY